MSVRLDVLDVGDVLCTRNSRGWAARLIRLGAALLDRPNVVNHVIVVHHYDAKTRKLWGIEARSKGVGWIELTPKLLGQPYLLSNHEQPKTDDQRFLIAKGAEKMLKTPYDWYGILLDFTEALGRDVQTTWLKQQPPLAVVCSSLADWCYDYAGVLSPGQLFDRTVTPGDWAKFIIEKEWLT